MILQGLKRKSKSKSTNKNLSKNIILASLAFFLILNIFFTSALVTKFNILEIFFSMGSKNKFNGVTLLAFGVDSTHSSKRADSIMVIHLDGRLNYLGVLSIPRDTRLHVEGHGKTRVNHAYSYGGQPLLKKTISNFLNIPIDYYLKVNLDSITTLVDELGGVELEVEKDLNYIDQAGSLYIDLKKGKQVLSGDQVVQYLRFRQDNEGDIGRIRRQQKFVFTLANEFIKPSNIFELPKIINHISNVIETDLSTSQMLSLSTHFKEAYKRGSIKKETIPGKLSLVGNAYYWEPFEDEIQAVLATVFNLSSSNVDSIALNSVKNEPELVQVENKPKKSISILSSKIYAEELFPDNPKDKPEDVQTVEENNYGVEKISGNLEKSFKLVSLENQLDTIIPQQSDQNKMDNQDMTHQGNNHSNLELWLSSQDDTQIVLPEESKRSQDTENTILTQKPVETYTETTPIVNDSDANNKIIASKPEIDVQPKQIIVAAGTEDVFETITNIASLTGIIEVLNGYGAPKEAQYTAKFLKRSGMSVSRFADAGHFNYENTVLVDWKGNQVLVIEVSNVLAIQPQHILVRDRPEKSIDFTLVLGKDWPEVKELILKSYNQQ